LDVNITDKSNWEKTVEVNVPTIDLEPDFEKALQDYKKKISLEGFRKGKVPMQMIKRIFGKEIENLVAENKITDILEDLRTDKKIRLISPAKIEDFSYDRKDGLKFTARLEVIPEIEVKNYKKFSLEKEMYQVSDEDVADALDNLRERYAVMSNIEQEAQIGHYLIANFQKLDQTGLPIVGDKYENRYIYLAEKDGEKNNELTAQLLGVKTGDTRIVQLSYTDDKNQQQVDKYSVSIKEVKQKDVPQLDDEFAKDVGDYDNLEALRLALKENLEFEAKNEYDNRFNKLIVDELVKANNFEVPEPMVKNYLDMLVDEMGKESKKSVDKEMVHQDYRTDAIRNIKWMLIRDKIVELESISTAESEVDNLINQFVEQNKKNGVKIKNYYRDSENRKKLEEELLDKKIFEFLANNARVSEKIIKREDLKKESKIIV